MVGTSGSRASCCEICTSERVISPVLVLSLHGLIVTDVAWHRAELWQDDGLWYRGLRLLVLLTVACYLRTSLTDPGFLQVGGQPANATCCSAQGCMLLCCAAAVSMSEWKGASKEGNPMMLPEVVGASFESEMKVLPSDAASSSQLDNASLDFDYDEGILKRRGPVEDLEADNSPGTQLRWCKRCQLHQPLRTKHCHDCGRCVRTHDHHCPWIGSCVGENNRVLFFWYLLLQCVELAAFFYEGMQGISLLEPSVVLLVGLIFIAVFFLMVSCLLCFHTFLMLANLTTWEHISWLQITYLLASIGKGRARACRAFGGESMRGRQASPVPEKSRPPGWWFPMAMALSVVPDDREHSYHPLDNNTTPNTRPPPVPVTDEAELEKLSMLRRLSSSKSESSLRARTPQRLGSPLVVLQSSQEPVHRKPSLSARSRSNSGRLSSPPDDVEQPRETCPVSTLFMVVQDMMALKYGMQLDEFDFVSKAKARCTAQERGAPRRLCEALNAEPALKVKDASNERLIQLHLRLTTVASYAELQGFVRRWPGTACAVAAVGLGGADRNVQFAAVFREAYGDRDVLVAKTRAKAYGGVGPLHMFAEADFQGAVVLEPAIEHVLKYEPEANVMIELKSPPQCPEFEKSAVAFDAEAALSSRALCAAAALAPRGDGPSASCLLAKELMVRHPTAPDIQTAGCKVPGIQDAREVKHDCFATFVHLAQARLAAMPVELAPVMVGTEAASGVHEGRESIDPDEEAQVEKQLLAKARQVPLQPDYFTGGPDAPAKIGRIHLLRCFGRTAYIGPHWPCSIIMLAVILGIGSSFVMYHTARASLLHSGLGVLATVGSAISFLCSAVSSPGILQPRPGSKGGPGEPEQYFASNGKRHCTACNIKQPVGTLHCDYCHVCIVGWDHHCPWMNKCIGESNLFFFNSFLGISMTSLGYIVLATMLIS
ncbi:PAT06 [Symbiodinium microadriaticum]|nr:PAT06 [Symbiodinium microadriaticum]